MYPLYIGIMLSNDSIFLFFQALRRPVPRLWNNFAFNCNASSFLTLKDLRTGRSRMKEEEEKTTTEWTVAVWTTSFTDANSKWKQRKKS